MSGLSEDPLSESVSFFPRELIAEFCQRWQIDELAVFGSMVSGEAGTGSDLDELVQFSADAQWSLLDHVQMQQELATLVGPSVDLVSKRALDRSSNWMRRESILESAEVVFPE